MTGTAETEAQEFRDIYKLDVMVIPTNRPVRRVDKNDMVYRTKREKYKALIDEIVSCYNRGQPVLVGTISVETSELISRMLKREGIPHNVLNAKYHEREAEIVALAGQKGAVTIATNMAGRGTDIKLGEGVVYFPQEVIRSNMTLSDVWNGKTLREHLLENPCGLYVIGSERHESRRIDRQLRGRCARQGDPGMSRFYVSLEDDLMRLFGSERIANLMSRMGIEEGQELQHPLLNRSIETAQKRVEQNNYSIRKRTLQYDDVMNKQREIIYGFRGEIVKAENVREIIYDVLAETIENKAEEAYEKPNEESLEAFRMWVNTSFPVGISQEELEKNCRDKDDAFSYVFDKVKRAYDLKIQVENQDTIVGMERFILLNTIDTHWQEYLRAIDHLRQSVSLRAYGQQDPLIEYKKEAYQMFSTLMDTIKNDIATRVFRTTTQVKSYANLIASLPKRLMHFADGKDAASLIETIKNNKQKISNKTAAVSSGLPVPNISGGIASATIAGAGKKKVGRNDPCPCGSGKKYKKCCGAI